MAILEGGCVLAKAVECTSLSCHALDKHPDGHARREGVGVDDDVGGEARLAKGHVDVGPLDTAHTLLTVTRGKLVTDRGLAREAKDNRDLLEHLVTIVVADQADLLDVGWVGALEPLNVREAGGLVEDTVQGVAVLKSCTHKRKAVLVQLARDLAAVADAKSVVDGLAAYSVLGQVGNLCLVDHAVAKASFKRRLVENLVIHPQI